MRTEHIRESKPATLGLFHRQATALKALGVALASKKAWWGQGNSPLKERSVLRCSQISEGEWEVSVSDAIGVISIAELQLIVEPKIPLEHFVYVIRFASSMPRLVSTPADLTKHHSFWDVIVAWFLTTLHNALRGGLIRDYTETTEMLPYIRGRTAYVDAARRYLRGVLEFDCIFEDFQRDTPLNRVLKAAAQRVIISSSGGTAARRIVLLMDDVGQLRADDIRFEIDRRSARYADAFVLAKYILANTGWTLLEGDEKAWTFLIRTPEVLEDGLRSLLQKKLGDNAISKTGRQFGTLTLNPDLLFSTGNIADVKYKLNKAEWHRPDFYEVIAFATGFKAPRAAVINFRTTLDEPVDTVDVGPIQVSNICWNCASFSDPAAAESAFVHDIRKWNA